MYVQDLDRGTLDVGRPSSRRSRTPAIRRRSSIPYKAEFHRREDDLALKFEVAVAAEDDVEIRQLVLTNHGEETRRLRLTSYAEVVLAPQEADQRHPAFNKLFIESEFLPELNALIFHRRPRSADEEPVFLVHMLVANLRARRWCYETDRARFLGRGGTPRAPLACSRDRPARPMAPSARRSIRSCRWGSTSRCLPARRAASIS